MSSEKSERQKCGSTDGLDTSPLLPPKRDGFSPVSSVSPTVFLHPGPSVSPPNPPHLALVCPWTLASAHRPRPPGLGPSHLSAALQRPAAARRAPRPAPAGGALRAPPPPPPLPPVGHRHPPAPRGRRPGGVRGLRRARALVLRHSAAAPAPRPARRGLGGAPARLRHLAPHATRPLPAGDALRGPAAPAAARRRRPAPAGALAHRPGPRLRGADAPRGGGHAAAGGLRGPRVPPAAAALHRLRAGLPCGRALCRRDPGGRGSPLHAARAAAGPGAGPAGAQAPAARLHAHRSADHHLLLLAHGHHRYFQGGAGAHGPGARRHGVGRDRLARGAELLLHLPGGGHRGHGALHHPHRGHHHRRAAPRELLGSVRTPPARRRPAPLHLSAACAPAADPRGALHTRPRGCRTGMRPKLGLRGSPRGAGTLRIQFLRNRAEAHTPKDAASLGPSQTPGPRRPRLPSPLKAAPPGKLREGPSRSREPGPASPASSIGSAPALKTPASRSAGSAFFSSSRGASGRRLGLGHRASTPDRQTPPVLAA